MLEGYVHNLFHYGPSPKFGEWVQSPPLQSNYSSTEDAKANA